MSVSCGTDLEDGHGREEETDGSGGSGSPVDQGGLELADLFGGDVAQSLFVPPTVSECDRLIRDESGHV